MAVKVKCTKTVTVSAIGTVFNEGETYDVPANVADTYGEYLERVEKPAPKTKKSETEEDK